MTKKLKRGESRDVTPEGWKTGQEAALGTFTVDAEKKSVTVNLMTDRERLDKWRASRKPLPKRGEKK